jgi:hypothetical protein
MLKLSAMSSLASDKIIHISLAHQKDWATTRPGLHLALITLAITNQFEWVWISFTYSHAKIYIGLPHDWLEQAAFDDSLFSGEEAWLNTVSASFPHRARRRRLKHQPHSLALAEKCSPSSFEHTHTLLNLVQLLTRLVLPCSVLTQLSSSTDRYNSIWNAHITSSANQNSR